MKYRAEIDGLRAVAILPVVFFHAGSPLFSGGFVGVDVFFVISGYLITSIIASERADGRFTVTGFYARRMKRIFPALFVMLGFSYIAALIVLTPSAMREFAQSVVAASLFWSNHFFLDHSGYFATAAELQPLLHSWSLAVEEQFYVLFPAFLLLTWRFGRRRQIAIMAAVALASLTAAAILVARQPAVAFFILPTRLWELMIGAMAALVLAEPQPPRGPAWLRAALPALGLGLIAAAVFGYDPDTPFPGIAALVPAVGAVLVIVFADGQSAAGRVLSHPTAVFIGLTSYSFYLWHYPLLAFARHLGFADNAAVLAAACLLAFAIAVASWRFVEAPVRQAKGVGFPQVATVSAAVASVLLALGLAGSWSSGFRDFYIAHRLDGAARQAYLRYSASHDRSSDAPADRACVFRVEGISGSMERRFTDCARRYGKATLLIGDSHAISLYNALSKAGVGPFFVSVSKGGCRPNDDKALCPYKDLVEFVTRHRSQIARVVVQLSGSHLVLDQSGREDSADAFVPGAVTSIDQEAIDRIVAYLGKLANNVTVIWLGPYAEPRVDLGDPQNFAPAILKFRQPVLDLFGQLDLRLKAVAARDARISYVSLVDALRFAPSSLAEGDCLTFRDGDHFSACGERIFGPVIAQALDVTADPMHNLRR